MRSTHYVSPWIQLGLATTRIVKLFVSARIQNHAGLILPRPALLQFHDAIYQTAHSIIISKCCTHYGGLLSHYTHHQIDVFLLAHLWARRTKFRDAISTEAAVRSILAVTSVLVLFAVAHRQCLRERKSGPKSCLRNKVINPGNCFAIYRAMQPAREHGIYVQNDQPRISSK